MVNMVVGVLGVTVRMLLRYWAKDNEKARENIVDVEQFAQECGLTIWEAKRFHRTIDEFIDTIAENFIREFGEQIENEERKEAIFRQIQDDIEKINMSNVDLIKSISNADDLRNSIMNQSRKERESWSDIEIGVYTNCVRYISKAGIEFMSKLPNFKEEALKVVIERQSEYHQELCGILADIHSMTKLIKSVDTTYREYESIYREKLIEKYSKVELIGAGINHARNVTRYDISSAYVELSCVSEEKCGEEIPLHQVFSNNNVVWIKGEAGSGKTTFLQWVAECAAKNEYQKIDNIKDTIPIVVELRNAAVPICLQEEVNRITTVYGSNCPDGWILGLLKKERAILLFDGLDEISQIKRTEVYQYVEDIAEQYPHIKILLTARNSVKDCIACKSVEYEILPMRIENIKKFIDYWHRAVLRKDAIIEDQAIDRLQVNLKKKIINSPSLKTLAKNPLLCAMICALNYVNNEQLPDNKMELYRKCCEMLIDARDTQRKIDGNIYKGLPNLDYDKKRKILEELAYWMMRGNVVSESRDNVQEYLECLLQNTNILSDAGKVYSVKDVLDYLIDRSGIIREPEEGTINFIHKTFMEFLAVGAICRNCDRNILVKEACNTNWKETIIMCFQEMGQDKVVEVLERLVNKGKKENDERYILMAALGAANAFFLSNKGIKEEIDNKIKKMIPPKKSELTEISQAGIYLLPFLNDSNVYSNDEKERCLSLLERIGAEEAIPQILSYIEGNGGHSVKIDALNILSGFKSSVLEEYNVREQLVNILLDIINDDTITVYECMTDVIGGEELLNKDVERIGRVKKLRLICGVSEESMYRWETKIFRYFRGCKEVILSGTIRSAYFLTQFMHIESLTIRSDADISEVVRNLQNIKNLISVKKLYIHAAQLHYFYEQDLCSMKDLEILELHCMDDTLKIYINNFDYFSKLQKVILRVSDSVSRKVSAQIDMWKGKRDDLEIVVCDNMFV